MVWLHFFHLDNPDPVERETISNPKPNIQPDWTPKSGSCTPLVVPKSFSVSHCNQRWPESPFQTPTPLLFQNFWIRIRLLFKFQNPTPLKTPATIIHPTVTAQTSATSEMEKWLRIRVRFFTNFWFRVRMRVRKKHLASCRGWLRNSGSGPTSDCNMAPMICVPSWKCFLKLQKQSILSKIRNNYTMHQRRNENRWLSGQKKKFDTPCCGKYWNIRLNMKVVITELWLFSSGGANS